MKGPALAGLFFFVEAALKTFISSAILPYLGQVLFSILKLYAKLAIKIYCRKIIINKPSTLRLKGPLLIAANHPNSFLDGIIFSTLFEHETYLLARGDAFRKKHHSWILRKLYMLPVYRTSEGPENLNHNYATFAACQDAFEQGAIVVIFSEGSCFNEWHLRPLRKGTARLAISSWQKSIDLPVIPAGINYNTFRSFGKNVFLNFGTALNREEILQHETDGKLFSSFNEQLNEQLQQLVYEINPEDKKEQKRRFYIQLPTWKKMILSLPALVGFIIHSPLYFTAKLVTNIYFNNDHFDSALVSMLLLSYPIYLLVIFILSIVLFNLPVAIIIVLLTPFTAYGSVQLKDQVS